MEEHRQLKCSYKSFHDGTFLLCQVFKDTTQQSPYVPDSDVAPCSDGVERLTFNLSPRLQSAIERAREEVEGKTRTLHFDTLQYDRYGKDFIKQKNLSPDAIMQLAFQVHAHSFQMIHFLKVLSLTPTHHPCRWLTTASTSAVCPAMNHAVLQHSDMAAQRPFDQPAWPPRPVLRHLNKRTQLELRRWRN